MDSIFIIRILYDFEHVVTACLKMTICSCHIIIYQINTPLKLIFCHSMFDLVGFITMNSLCIYKCVPSIFMLMKFSVYDTSFHPIITQVFATLV